MSTRGRSSGSGGWRRPPNSLFPDHPGPARSAAGRAKKPRREPPAASLPPSFPSAPESAPAAAAAAPTPPAGGAAPPTARLRVVVGAVLMGVWAALILGQLAQIQLLEHQTMVQRADSQHHHELTIPPFRGRIYDRNGRPLALTVAVDSVYVVPPDYPAAAIPVAADRLSACLGVSRNLVERRLRRASRFSWLKRKATAAEVACARETGLPVGTIEEYGRFYPGAGLAAHVLGFVGMDNDGLGGIEHALDPVLRGEPGRRTVWTDGRRTGRESRVVRESRPGADVELTIDSYLQAVAEEELERGIAEFSATSGAVILIEPATGDVLAMASAPSFDPNRARDYPAATLVNRTITDPYEPGSVFKMFTAAAALNEGVTHENEEFDTFGGAFPIGSRTVRDWKPLGPLTFAGVIRRSSNIGTLQVASRLGSETLRGYLDAFGFGEPTGLPLGGESRGIMPARGVWRPIRLATVSFGQGIAVTPVQLVQGVNTIATSGVRRPLRLIRRIGGETEPVEPGRPVVTPTTADRVAWLLSGAVASGTGGNASVEGFLVAGKTGTAQKAARGGYSSTDYTASFAGFAPALDPIFTGVVILDVQKPNHRGANAARVFGRVAERVLWRYRRTGWGTERLARAGSGGGPLGAPRDGVVVPVSQRAETLTAGAALSARDRVARRLRLVETTDPEDDEGILRVADRGPAVRPPAPGPGVREAAGERPAAAGDDIPTTEELPGPQIPAVTLETAPDDSSGASSGAPGPAEGDPAGESTSTGESSRGNSASGQP